MTRRKSITLGYLIVLSLAFLMCILVYTCTPSKNVQETQVPEKEGIMIDGHAVEVVYDDYGSPYLKYVIGPMKFIYIPMPTESETDNTDSLKSFYTHGKEINTWRLGT